MRISRIFCAAALCFAFLPCRAAETAEAVLNRLAGQNIFGDTELWREAPSAAIWRLNINCRADTSGREQMFAQKLRRRIFGCAAEEIRIFAVDRRMTRVDIFFLNKGDSTDTRRGSTGFRKALRDSHHELEKLLTADLGKSRRVNFAGAGTKRQLPAWTAGRYVLVVDYAADEYLIMRIVPPEALGRKNDSSSGASAPRRSFADRVKRNDRGDVFIADVPMVNQGPKGYCVPATLERLARYYGISGVDMHKLAERADTRDGGGTSVRGMLRSIHKLLGGYHLHVRSVGGLRKSTIARYVEQGMPLMWIHYSTPEFQKQIEKSFVSRGRAAPGEWRRQLRRQRLIKKGTTGAHIALIIGFNKESGEAAISNSWGERHRIEWVRFADMERVDSALDLYVMVPRK